MISDGVLTLGVLAVIAGALGYAVLSGWREARQVRDQARRRQGRSWWAAQIRVRMRTLALPTLLLGPIDEPGFSKLGGEPELPASHSWPPGAKAPRSFLAQVDLAAVRAAGGPDWLPAEGRLYAFHDDERYGFADVVRLLFSIDPPGPPVPAPKGLSAKRVFGERRVGFRATTSIPSLVWLNIDVSALDNDIDLDTLPDPEEPFGEQPHHRIGGYPGEIQGEQMALACEYLARGLDRDFDQGVPPAIERASKTWRLVLQIDSDRALGVNWGDTGRLYVFIREPHARAGDFTRTVTLADWY